MVQGALYGLKIARRAKNIAGVYLTHAVRSDLLYAQKRGRVSDYRARPLAGHGRIVLETVPVK
jgi:hypothetical protein